MEGKTEIRVNAAFERAARAVLRVLPAKESLLPALSGFRLTKDGEDIGLTATNLDVFVSAKAQGAATGQGELDVFLPGKEALNIMKSLGNFSAAANGSFLVLRGGKGEYRLRCLDPGTLPAFPAAGSQSFSVANKALCDAVLKTAHAAFDQDFSSAMPAYCSVRFRLSGKELTLAATNDYRLAVASLAVDSSTGEEMQFLVPSKSLVDATKSLAVYEDAPLQVFPSKSHVLLVRGDVTFAVRLVSAAYPDVEKLLAAVTPAESCLDLPPQELIAALERAGLLSGRRPGGRAAVSLSASPEGLLLVVDGLEGERAEEYVAAQGLRGEPFSCKVDYKYLLEGVLHAKTKAGITISISKSGANKHPFVVITGKGDNYLYLLAPIV